MVMPPCESCLFFSSAHVFNSFNIPCTTGHDPLNTPFGEPIEDVRDTCLHISAPNLGELGGKLLFEAVKPLRTTGRR
jgi:hypothetical protein